MFVNVANLACPVHMFFTCECVSYHLRAAESDSLESPRLALQTRGTVQGGSFIAPNDMVEAIQITGCITAVSIDFDPFFQVLAINSGGYLAQIFLVKESNK